MSKNKFIYLSLLLLAVVFIFSGCTKKVAEKTTERAIEKNIGSQADVDLADNQITVATEQGTYQGGENLSLPANFPDDIYVLDGKIVAAMTLIEKENYSVSILTEQSVGEVKSKYESELKASGWTINLQMDYGESAVVSATKADRTVSVSISNNSDGTTVTIVTGKN